MGLLDSVRQRQIQPLAEPTDPVLNNAATEQQSVIPPPQVREGDVADQLSGGEAGGDPSSDDETGNGVQPALPSEATGEGDDYSNDPDAAFPEENESGIQAPISTEDLSAAGSDAFDVAAMEGLGVAEITDAETKDTAKAVKFLEQDAALKGQSRTGSGHGTLAVGHTFKPGYDLAKQDDANKAVAAKRRDARESTQEPDHDPNRQTDSDSEAADRRIQLAMCVDNPKLIAAKLRKFSKVLYLNPLTWDADTITYMIKAYTEGVAIKVIYDRVSAPASVFNDAEGNKIPTYKNTRAEIGNVRLIDVYGVLATCIYQTLFGKGTVMCCDSWRTRFGGEIVAKEVVGLAGIRRLRHDGEVHLTTFVDMIFYDVLNPGQLGQQGLSSWLRTYDENMTANSLRRMYESILTPLRQRWKRVNGETITRKNVINSISGTTVGAKILRQLDDAMCNRTAFLTEGGRKFLLMEWPDELPIALTKFSTLHATRQPSDMRLFLRKFLETFDPSVVFNTRVIDEIRANLGPTNKESISPIRELPRTQAEGMAKIVNADADPFA